MKRRIYRLKWDRVDCGWLLHNSKGTAIVVGANKKDSESWSRKYCRDLWELGFTPCQLLIYTKAGRIGKGGRYEASYGCDSKRRKG